MSKRMTPNLLTKVILPSVMFIMISVVYFNHALAQLPSQTNKLIDKDINDRFAKCSIALSQAGGLSKDRDWKTSPLPDQYLDIVNYPKKYPMKVLRWLAFRNKDTSLTIAIQVRWFTDDPNAVATGLSLIVVNQMDKEIRAREDVTADGFSIWPSRDPSVASIRFCDHEGPKAVWSWDNVDWAPQR